MKLLYVLKQSHLLLLNLLDLLLEDALKLVEDDLVLGEVSVLEDNLQGLKERVVSLEEQVDDLEEGDVGVQLVHGDVGQVEVVDLGDDVEEDSSLLLSEGFDQLVV